MRRHVIVEGRVQGVGFRYFTRRTALGRGLTGWVRNLPDGRVEAELQGPVAEVEAAILALREGPTLARVLRLDLDARPERDDETDFEIRH